jgi:NADH:ubiquinone oxidoreductase subunit E
MTTHHHWTDLDKRSGHFFLQGRYLGGLPSSKERLKYMRLQTEQGERHIKLPDYVRYALMQEVELGSWVRVWVRSKGDKLKAVMVIPLPPKTDVQTVAAIAEVAERAIATICKIQVCQKGSCCKRGAAAVLQALQGTLAEWPTEQSVQVEATGCLKDCKRGPNLKIGSVFYNQVQPHQIPGILQHQLGFLPPPDERQGDSDLQVSSKLL